MPNGYVTDEADLVRACRLMRDGVPPRRIAEQLNVTLPTLRALVRRAAVAWLELREEASRATANDVADRCRCRTAADLVDQASDPLKRGEGGRKSWRRLT